MTDRAGVIACPNCGFSHLRGSRPRNLAERLRAWWTGTAFFRCQTCEWRGPLHDEWNVLSAFPNVRPLNLARELDIEGLEERDEQGIVELLLAHRDGIGRTLRVWLDDSRPAPAGWVHLRSVPAAQQLLSANLVHELSLDHDLGWCADCIREGAHLRSGRRHCPHTATGYDLCVWMADTGTWPAEPPAVHSGNLEGGARMLGLIARHWSGGPPGPPTPGSTSPDATSASPSGRAPSGPLRDQTAMSPLTTCPACGARRLGRVRRRGSLARVRTLLTRRYPARCEACGWSRWVRDPILVRLSSSAAEPSEELTRTEFDRIDPEE
ncbi:MAG TPA: cyclic-phosphate processing receiver domain-containing protein [Vicinamibacterales bacterium]|nr:cyclic-phosphate processing receiver domain-containing protein [Vicinamibacterales bacterium]